MNRAARRLLVWLSIAIAGWVGGVSEAERALAQTASEQREAAVLKARAGQMAEAQAALRAMLAAGTDDGLVAMDLTTLLQQDGKPAEAVAVFETAARADPPDYALLAATRAYRDLRRYVDAARLARAGMQRFPGDTVWPLILSLVLSDDGKATEALAILRQPAAQRAPLVERLLAEAYAWRRAGDPFKAMRVYSEAIKAAPANPGVRLEAAGVLQDMGAPFGAEVIAGTRTPSIAADQAAAMVRWGAQVRSADPARRFDGTDAALARLDQLLAALPPPPAEAGLRRRLRLDRMVALRDRMRMREAAEEGEALSADGALPPHAEEAYADALLYLRRPEAAREAYERVLAQSPKDVKARYGKFYASVEMEDFTTAYATIDDLVGDEPTWRAYKDDPSRYDNPERAYAQVTAAQARYYGNQLGEAWDRITKFSDAAPANANGRYAVYQIAKARGWPQRAEAEAQIAASLAPERRVEDRPDRGGDGQLPLRRSAAPDGRAARTLSRGPGRAAPGARTRRPAPLAVRGRGAAQQLRRRRRQRRGPGADPAGQAHDAADRRQLSSVRDRRLCQCPPARGLHRAGARRRRRGMAHPEPHGHDLAYAILGHLRPAGRRGHGRLGHRPGAAYLRRRALLWDTPLRALLFGITADEYAAKATYRWHESRSLVASFAMPFTDGNDLPLA
jgi:biofilm PGA synthesis protein PgaA